MSDNLKNHPPIKSNNRLGVMWQLEPRMMFDGAIVDTSIDVAEAAALNYADQTAHTSHIQNNLPVSIATSNDEKSISPETNDRKDAIVGVTDENVLENWLVNYAAPTAPVNEIVFVDTRISDYATILAGIDPNIPVVLLDSQQDGVEQIARYLVQNPSQSLDAIHLISEGNEAELHLGSSFLTQESLTTTYAEQFRQIGNNLSQNADILIYGCNFGHGDAGQLAMTTLADLTGADIAASTNRTGHVTEFGDWHLERSTGMIESAIVIGEATQSAWTHALATYTVTNTNDSGAA